MQVDDGLHCKGLNIWNDWVVATVRDLVKTYTSIVRTGHLGWHRDGVKGWKTSPRAVLQIVLFIFFSNYCVFVFLNEQI